MLVRSKSKSSMHRLAEVTRILKELRTATVFERGQVSMLLYLANRAHSQGHNCIKVKGISSNIRYRLSSELKSLGFVGIEEWASDFTQDGVYNPGGLSFCWSKI